jgi:hypothetical protein
MAGLGNQQYWERADPALVSDDEPLTAFNAWMMRENGAHLISSFPQYRVNWCQDNNAYTHLIRHNSGDDTLLVSFAFPVTIPEYDRIASFDVRVGALVSNGSATGTIRARLLWDRYPPEASTAATTQPNFYDATNTTTSTAGEWVLDTPATGVVSSDNTYRQSLRDYVTDDGGTNRTVRAAMARLDVIVSGTYGAGGWTEVLAVQVREFV